MFEGFQDPFLFSVSAAAWVASAALAFVCSTLKWPHRCLWGITLLVVLTVSMFANIWLTDTFAPDFFDYVEAAAESSRHSAASFMRFLYTFVAASVIPLAALGVVFTWLGRRDSEESADQALLDGPALQSGYLALLIRWFLGRSGQTSV